MNQKTQQAIQLHKIYLAFLSY
uniref:Uncharacterized protein n=1 Tax=Arundo donax TaxID=35708 RepID=A0A0A9BL61_ARUDO